MPVQELIEDRTLLIGDGYRARNDELSRKGLPFARAQNIDGGFKFVGADCFPEGALSRVGNKVSQPGDVVFTSKGTVGRFAFVRTETPRFVYSPQLCFWRSLNHERIVPRWLFYWMQGRDFYEQYKSVAGQTDMADYVSLRDQRRMSISLPQVSEQRAIADILGTLDDKIELNRRTIEAVEAIARALFKSWFIDFDPVYAKASGELTESICRRFGLTPDALALFPDRFRDSELGEIPEGWTIQSVYDLATYINGAAYRTFEPNEERHGLPIIKIAELKAGVTEQTAYSDVQMQEKYQINRGDLLFSWSGNPDTSIDTFVWAHGPAWLNQHIFRVIPESSEERSFVFLTLKHLRPVFAEIARNKQTTGLGHVTAEDMKRLKIVKPPEPTRNRWNETVDPLLDQMFLRELESQTLDTLLDTLLPGLISGQLRIPVAW